jgi:AcrR family transcriptional regulator
MPQPAAPRRDSRRKAGAPSGAARERGRAAPVSAAERPYHHGDLRSALLEQALLLIKERGPQGFTLREVARRAGVSHAAPYRHFADRSALLTAVAAAGSVELGVAVQGALDAVAGGGRGTEKPPGARQPAEDLRARFLAAGFAYVRFAIDRPAHFQVMFFAQEVDKADPSMLAAKGRTFGILLDFIREGQRAGLVVAGDPETIAIPIWAMHHGLACLASSSAFAEHGPKALRSLIDGAHAALLDGILREPRGNGRRGPATKGAPTAGGRR